MGSFSAFRNNKIGNTGATRFAAKWEPQKRKAKRVKKILSGTFIGLLRKPNIDDMNEGNWNSIIPIIDINDAASK